MKGVFLHHVFFWLENENSQADLEQLVKGLQTLTTIPGIRQYHIGIPATTRREVIDSTYAVSWFLQFDNARDQDDYQAHPVHLQFVNDYSHLWKKVRVYDAIDK